jgi:acyl transferase domain-containing protein
MDRIEHDDAVAIIGMAGRFPGARNVDQLWALLKSGSEALSRVTEADLSKAGVSESALQSARYIRMCMRLEDADCFDAEFFGYSPGQAANIDPQQRLFLECAWEALDVAGHSEPSLDNPVGIFAGAGFSEHLFRNVRAAEADHDDRLQQVLDSDKDFLTSRVAYKLGLTGPSITVQTACSTSLVAVHLACRSLLDFECNLALAGGVSVAIPQGRGYLYLPGGPFTPDGHCRAFDAAADGTMIGSGVGIVVLRRLIDAVAAGDQIYAVIRSSVVNNDGAQKVGYTAPSARAQARLLAAALALARLHPHDVGLIEAHGTGTPLGDAIELQALNEAYASIQATRHCALGSIKTNIGHLDTAAGVAGLIKAVLCLKNKQLVPSLNFLRPNPLLDAPGCPFYVNTELRPWESAADRPRRAGVTSLGAGGTNAHVILEEWLQSERVRGPVATQLFPLSARDPAALGTIGQDLASHLEKTPEINFDGVAYTLQVGRRRMRCRRVLLASSTSELISLLRMQDPAQQGCFMSERRGSPVAFMFPGQSPQRVGVARNLYQSDGTFRRELDGCASLFRRFMDIDILSQACGEAAGPTRIVDDLALVQPFLFSLEYCLARTLIARGVTPDVLVGQSFGEYAAACIAEVFTLEEAVELVACRSRLISRLPTGRMLAAEISEDMARERMRPDLSIAAINADDQCVISGRSESMQHLAEQLRLEGIQFKWLQITHAGHSPMLLPAALELREVVQKFSLQAPRIPIASCVTGGRVQAHEITQPGYWKDHLLLPVQFAKALAVTAGAPNTVLVEVGPGRTLTNLARRNLRDREDVCLAASLEDAEGVTQKSLLNTVGSLWSSGAEVAWNRFHDVLPPRVALPSYPFDRKRYSGQGGRASERAGKAPKSPAIDASGTRVYLPSLKPHLPLGRIHESPAEGAWLVLVDGGGLGRALVQCLRADARRAIAVEIADAFVASQDGSFAMDPTNQSHYKQLLDRIAEQGDVVARIIHCWSMEPGRAQEVLDAGATSLLWVVQALVRAGYSSKAVVMIVTSGLAGPAQSGAIRPGNAALPALSRAISQEIPGIRCLTVDVQHEGPLIGERRLKLARRLLADMSRIDGEQVVFYRGEARFVQVYEEVRLPVDGRAEIGIRREGFYVITGGFVSAALALSHRLASSCAARLLLITNEPFPDRTSWSDLLAEPDSWHDSVIGKILHVQELERLGARVLVLQADIADEEALRRAMEEGERQHGRLNGLFHLAAQTGVSPGGRRVQDIDDAGLSQQLQQGLAIARACIAVLSERKPDFAVVLLSNAFQTGAPAEGMRAAAEAIVGACAGAANATSTFPWITASCDQWTGADVVRPVHAAGPFFGNRQSLTELQALSTLLATIGCGMPMHVVIRASDPAINPPLPVEIDGGEITRVSSSRESQDDVTGGTQARVTKVPPRTALERSILDIWKEVLGNTDIGVEERFLDLGGDSLIALRIIARLKDRFGIGVSLVSISDSNATVARTAQEIDELISLMSVTEPSGALQVS